MHEHRIVAPERGTFEHTVQRQVLIELLDRTPGQAHLLIVVAVAIRKPPRPVRDAALALQRAGLAIVEGQCVEASATAWYFETLWPIAI